MRVEDLDDRTHDDIAERQLADLAALGITWDGPATRQTGHPQRYDAVVDTLSERGLVYECYCTRRDIASGPAGTARP